MKQAEDKTRGRGRKKRPFGRRHGGKRLYAAIDLGTNNCRLLIATPNVGGFRVVDSFSHIVRLGEGLGETGQLSEAAMDRTISKLKICAAKIRNQEVARVRCVATAACRQANNGAAFVARVRRETGLQLEIIGGATEAELAVEGCRTLFDGACAHSFVFDIGGGSTEVTRLDRNTDGQFDIVDTVSLPIGVVSLAEKFGLKGIEDHKFTPMRDHAAKEFAVFFERQNDIADPSNVQLIGTSGTVTTLAAVHLGLSRYDRSKVDGCCIGAVDAQRVIADMLTQTCAQLAQHPCIGPQRADLVLAGCAVMDAVHRRFPVDKIWVADRGLREGILLRMMRRDQQRRSRTPRIRRPRFKIASTKPLGARE